MFKSEENLLNIAYYAYQLGFVPIPLNGKIPQARKWQNLRNKPEDILDVQQGRYPSKVRLIKHLIDSKSTKINVNNIGVLTGEPSGIVVVDIDVIDDGINKWNNLVQSNGGYIPNTLLVSTGGNGYHYYFKYTPELSRFTNSNRVIDLPIDFRTNGGMVVFPGSTSQSGNPYTIIGGVDQNGVPIIADIPPWLISILVLNSLYKKGIKNPTTEQFQAEKYYYGFL